MQPLRYLLQEATQTWACIFHMENRSVKALRYKLDIEKRKTLSVAERGAPRWDSVAIFNVLGIIIEEFGGFT